MGYVVLSSVALSLNVILTAYYTVIATLQFVSALSAATAVFALLAIAALIATTYALVDGIEKEQKVIEDKKAAIDNLKASNNILGSVYGSEATIFVRNTFEKIKQEFSDQFDFIQKDYNPLFESNATFSNKGKAADILIKYTNNEEFLKNYRVCLENASIF
ncbi:MAG: hypothetical protein K2L48_04565 [Mycoplasmoidaceae bacterium]|nr:hypothetical protein [Mycoplasmoidaceae bacterium]